MEIQKLLGVLLDFKKMFPKGKTMLIERVAINIDSLIDELYQTTNQSDFELMQSQYEKDIEIAYKNMVEAIIRKEYSVAVDYGNKWQQLENQRMQNEVFLYRAKKNFKAVGHE